MKTSYIGMRIFKRINEEYFDSNLPQAMVMLTEEPEDCLTNGGAITYWAGPDDVVIIVVDRALYDATWETSGRLREAIKHEAIHISLGNGEHTGVFLTECERLGLDVEEHAGV